jgi:predicted nucleic acid-binding protein
MDFWLISQSVEKIIYLPINTINTKRAKKNFESEAKGWGKMEKLPSLFRMSETVYIETSILGYLTARSTKDLILAANIEITRDWWEFRRSTFTLYISKVVLDEVARGDPEIAANRLKILNGVPLVELNQAVQSLATQFLSRSNLPPKASDDAVHIAAATVHGMDYLLTWNCKHIANAQIQRKLEEVSFDFGYQLPVICTPYELLGD